MVFSLTKCFKKHHTHIWPSIDQSFSFHKDFSFLFSKRGQKELPVNEAVLPTDLLERSPSPRASVYYLVGLVGILRTLVLHFESLHTDLEAVHGLDRRLGTLGVVEAHETWWHKNKNKWKSLDWEKGNVIIEDVMCSLGKCPRADRSNIMCLGNDKINNVLSNGYTISYWGTSPPPPPPPPNNVLWFEPSIDYRLVYYIIKYT